MSDNIRPKGRCCDCRWLGLNDDGSGTCEGPIPSVHQPLPTTPDVGLTAADVMVVRSCDCYEKRINPLDGDEVAGTIQPGHTCTVCPVLQSEIARLRRQAEPLTEEEGQAAWDAWDGGGEGSAQAMIHRDRAITIVKNRRA